MHIEINRLDADLYLILYASVGWEPPCKEQVVTALEHTMATFVAYEDERPVGMVRLIGDGGMSFYIKDFAVIPSYQSRGVGSCLVESVETFIKNTVGDWAVSLELISTKEAVGFYEEMGFEARPSACDGPGMFKMVRGGTTGTEDVVPPGPLSTIKSTSDNAPLTKDVR